MVAASAESWAVFFHLLGAFVLVSGVVVAGVAFEAARRRRRPGEVALLLRLTRVGVLLVVAGALVVLVFGLWLVDLDDAGFGTTWVEASLGLFVAMLVVGAIGGQRPKRARMLATQLDEQNAAETPELRAMLDDRTALVLNYLSAALLLAIVVLMVFQPGD